MLNSWLAFKLLALPVFMTLPLFCSVGEEDEVSIRDAAESIVEAMALKGELVVSFSESSSEGRTENHR